MTVFGRKKICASGHLPAGPRDKILLQTGIYFCSTNFERRRYIYVIPRGPKKPPRRATDATEIHEPRSEERTRARRTKFRRKIAVLRRLPLSPLRSPWRVVVVCFKAGALRHSLQREFRRRRRSLPSSHHGCDFSFWRDLTIEPSLD